jgi:YndJ-like protein
MFFIERMRAVAIGAGLMIWLATVAFLPAALAARVLLLAPLVIVPCLLAYLPPRPWIARLAGWPALFSALPLIVAFGLPQGPLAAAFVVPWGAVAVVGAATAVVHGLPNLPSLLRPRGLPALGIDVALGFWAVGAGFALVDRLGIDIGFSPVIVLLTATHFHFAGFGLLGLASLLATSRSRLRGSVAGLIVGIPLTAAGFVLQSDPIGAVGALLVGLAGIGVGIALIVDRPPHVAGWTSCLAGVALLVGMPMGIAWSFSVLFHLSYLDIDTMIRTHGALNATAVLLGVLSFRGAQT